MLAKVEVPDTGSLFEDMVQQLHSVTQSTGARQEPHFDNFSPKPKVTTNSRRRF